MQKPQYYIVWCKLCIIAAYAYIQVLEAVLKHFIIYAACMLLLQESEQTLITRILFHIYVLVYGLF